MNRREFLKKSLEGIVLGSITLIYNCSKNPVKSNISQGVKGRIEFYEGNFMPSSSDIPLNGEVSYVKRKIFIFEKTHMNDVIAEEGGFYTAIKSNLVDTTESDNKGYFAIQLPIGEYSIFVWEKDKYYANRSDGLGYIFPVNVEKEKITEITFIIDYLAVY